MNQLDVQTQTENEAVSLKIAVLTLSDTRTLAEDRSGDTLVKLLEESGHQLIARDIILDDIYKIRAVVSQWIADTNVQVILTTGGTGFSGRDLTPEALRPLFDTEIEGFGETFRQVSFQEIGSSTVQSRALAGLANRTAIFCLPGSTGACKTAWKNILQEQLDSRHRPCNFVGILLQGKQLHS